MAFSNPGHVSRSLSFREYVKYREQERIACHLCLALDTDQATHCHDCGVCVRGYDHHCIVLGNCIGKNNLYAFYALLAAVPLGIVGLYLLAFFAMQACMGDSN